MTATGNPALDAGEESLQDRELLASLRAGEDAAFGELFSRHADAVRRLARSLASDRADAEDLTAEAFFRVLQAIRRGSGPVDNVRAYVLIVTRRVAWEWSERRRDVPVSDEVLSYRAGQNPDTAGQSHERSLIARAFTSLPERWRSVLWKVEVEGERPAVVAPKLGLSPNATAALARRARRGLRAAYLQAHLSTHHGSTLCRSILEKLGAYTAGTIKGAERRRVRAHLVTCSSCQSTHDELRDVCAGLRSYAGLTVAPVALGGLLAHKAGLWATLKGLVSGAGAKLTLATSSVLAAGVVGLVAGPMSADSPPMASLDFSGRNAGELAITGGEPTHPSPVTGSLSSSVQPTGHDRPVGGNIKPDPQRPGDPPAGQQPAVPPPVAGAPAGQQRADWAGLGQPTEPRSAPSDAGSTTIMLAPANDQPTTKAPNCIGASQTSSSTTTPSTGPSDASATTEPTGSSDPSAPTKTPEKSEPTDPSAPTGRPAVSEEPPVTTTDSPSETPTTTSTTR
jgi:RNA polymerase sigma factor (sigma-70 family)